MIFCGNPKGPKTARQAYEAPAETSLPDLKQLAWRDDVSPTGAALVKAGRHWQFLDFAPQELGQPRARSRQPGRAALAGDGRNLAEHLFELGQQAPQVPAGIVQTVAGVPGYDRDLQAVQTS